MISEHQVGDIGVAEADEIAEAGVAPSKALARSHGKPVLSVDCNFTPGQVEPEADAVQASVLYHKADFAFEMQRFAIAAGLPVVPKSTEWVLKITICVGISLPSLTDMFQVICVDADYF